MDPLTLLVDSPGITFLGDGEWQTPKHGPQGRRRWRQGPLGYGYGDFGPPGSRVPPQQRRRQPIRQENNPPGLFFLSSSSPELLGQIPEDQQTGTVSADGADDTRRRHAAISDRQAVPIVPIRKNGRPWKEDCPAARFRNETLRATKHYVRACLGRTGPDTTPEAAWRRRGDAPRHSASASPHGTLIAEPPRSTSASHS